MYVNVYVPKSGGSVVPKYDVYKYSDPTIPQKNYFLQLDNKSTVIVDVYPDSLLFPRMRFI